MADTVRPDNPFVTGPGRSPNLFLAAIIILAIFIVGSLVYLFGGSIGNLLSFTASNQATSATQTEIAAFRLARQTVSDYSDSKLLVATDIKKDRIELVFLGKIINYDAGRQLTLEKNGKQILLDTAGIQVEYEQKAKGEKERKIINSSDIKVNNDAYVRVGIDFNKASMYVIRVLVINEPVVELQENSI